ncbi:MAG: phospholipid carrier-dependent glycosyltransferase [Candidatus Aenigmarchaeota archaeon]|nr:phospholipid carrier-dependent glycosyltransferase [Candidatus Aenigmarchaeota archaeon]
MAKKEISLEFKKPEIIILILFLGLVLFLTAKVTIKTPINFGDEGFHTRTAQWIAKEKDYFAWFPFFGKEPNLAFGRTPLWNLTEAGFYLIFGFHEILGKLLPPLIAFFTGLSVYLLVKQLYSKEIGFIASIISVTIPSFVTYSVLLYVDVLFTFYFSLSVFTLALSLKKDNKKYFYLSVILGALSILTKKPGLAISLIFGTTFIYEILKKKPKDLILKYSMAIVIFILVAGGFFVRNLYYYKTPLSGFPIPIFNEIKKLNEPPEPEHEYPQRTEEVGTESGVLNMGIMNYLRFAYGTEWLVIFGFISGLLLMIIKRREMDILILLSLGTLILLFFQGISRRAEDTARYTLGWVPMIAVVVARYFTKIYEFFKKYQKQIALVVFGFIIVMSFLNLKRKTDGMMQIKQFSPLYFKACDWIKENTPQDSLIMTIWSNRAVYNCQRNVVGNVADISLSTDVNYTLNKTEEYGVTHIFLHKFSLSNKPMGEKYTVEFAQFLENNPEHFVNVFENGPALNECLQMGGCDGNIVYEVKYLTDLR